MRPESASNTSVAKAIVKLNLEMKRLSGFGEDLRSIGVGLKLLRLASFHLPENDPDVAAILLNLGTIYRRRGQLLKAAECFHQAAQRFQVSQGDSGECALSVNNLAHVLAALGQFSNAKTLLVREGEILRNLAGENDARLATNLSNLASIEAALGRPGEAEVLYLRALGIRRKQLDDHPEMASTLTNLGDLYFQGAQYEKAGSLHKQALELCQRLATVSQSTVLNNLAGVYAKLGDFRAAEQAYRQALRFLRTDRAADRGATASVLGNLAILMSTLGQYAEAERLGREALSLRRRIPGNVHPDVARGLSTLASVKYRAGDYAESVRLERQALAVRRKPGGNPLDTAASLASLFEMQFTLGHLADAERLCREALDIRRRLLGESHPDVANSLNDLAAIRYKAGAFAGAEGLLQTVLFIRRTVFGNSHPDVARALNNTGSVLLAAGRPEEAKPLFNEALQVRRRVFGDNHPEVARSLMNLGAFWHDRGDYADAEQCYLKARAVRVAALGKSHPDVSLTLHRLSALYAATGLWAEATDTLAESIRLDDRLIPAVFSFGSEPQRMALLAQMRRDFYRALSLAIAHAPAGQQAFELLLRRKGIGTEASAVQRSAVLAGRYPRQKRVLETLISVEARIARKSLAGAGPEGVAEHKALLTEWAREKEDLESRLAKGVPELLFSGGVQHVELKTITRILPEGSALVEFVRFPLFDFQRARSMTALGNETDHYAAFVVAAGHGNVRMIHLGAADRIDRLVANFRRQTLCMTESERPRRPAQARSFGSSSPARTHVDAALLLRASILDPVIAELCGYRRLFVAPNGALWQLPFEALPWNGGVLLDRYHISYLATARDLLRFQQKPGRGTPPLVAADPDFDLAAVQVGSTSAILPRHSRDLRPGTILFPRLRGARREGRKVAALLGVRPLLGKGATEGILRSCRSPSILHIATHGVLLPDQKERAVTSPLEEGADRLQGKTLESPLLRSALALAGANTWLRGGTLPEKAEDGMLTAQDVCGMDLLNTQLVVLSACQTALGEIRAGEGVFGLRRAFTIADARTLVMSLWPVPDDDTCDLMIDFYRRILSGTPRSDALREAKLAARDRGIPVSSWAAFICQGNPGPLQR